MNLIKNFKVSYTTKNINSKKLFNEINTTITEVVNDYIYIQKGIVDSTYNYTQLVEYVNVLMHDLLQRNIITQYDVICDERNNDPLVVRKGIIYLKIEFVQYNCLNRSVIEYKFSNCGG